MLILSRKVGETLVIGDNITVSVMSEKGGQIKLGINAPKHINVDREEIFFKRQNSVEGLIND
jgi:carbon storage regulator